MDHKIGLIVAKKMSNEGLTISKHAQHILNSYKQVYYVFFSGLGKTGPHLEDDLFLQSPIRQPLT
jgi:hypothetical protein